MKNIFNEMWGGLCMKARYGFFFGLGFMSSVLVTYLIGCAMIRNIPQDSVPEEILEQVIEGYTGLDLDLTPRSSER